MKLDKAVKLLGEDIVNEINAMDDVMLKNMLTQAEANIKTAKEQLEENPNYKQLKEDIKALRSGFTDVKKFQQSKILLALTRLEEMGKVVGEEQVNEG